MSVISRVFLGSLFLVVLPSVAVADCDGPQSELNRCADQEYRKQDKRLNEVYKKLEKTPELIRAEKAWIAFRDAECEWAVAEYEGGSITPMAHSYCLAGMTEERIKTLERALLDSNN